ncbi:MAG: beta-ketoacyl-[acyl-carrier-protein] synthase family protein [Planctomycetes bacterium]|nr:beta-ketoacyl-[acyl-carrier-protein] synthase family protein [Planctomycetota bacterium]MCH9727368.1 beta-ketoacyl-[acyl-carrier-protein] synthase family protein [Planctomycetota bacterium]MCH9777990.1 beta-ketoacyl-[acyl-carrier-protein] synthase family protein [Planctomycetota bacterium]MCH9791952.1 beta-ketoacyl-[acyl-carrier-protein] synthase family protein [Planctomycetota bacterium]MDF1746072.1 beta-ketoacyl-[acyl-carrier-protein] synthase family protein [Gimesia sp.]
MAGSNQTRVVISGIGVVSPIGIGIDAFWDSICSGSSGISRLESIPTENLPSKLAAEVKDFDPEEHLYNKKFLKVMSRDIQLGVSAASDAVRNAGIKGGTVDPDRFGVSFGAGHISTTPDELVEAVELCAGESFEVTRWGEDFMGQITPLWMLRQLPNMPACHISIEHNAQGPNNTITSQDSSALLALSEAMRWIKRGAVDCMVVGACTSNINPVDLSRKNLIDLLSRDEDPKRACRPFDRDRNGTILGEGAAAFVVENYEHAVRRGADIYAEVIGLGAGCDGHTLSDTTQQNDTGLVRAIESAMKQANLMPRELGHINAHGKSTKIDDQVEARAYHRLFGDDAAKIPITALKSYFGHFDAGSGAVELAASILSLRHGATPATLNYETPDPLCNLDIIHGGIRPLTVPTAMTVSRTSFGQSAAAILRAI